MKPRRTLSLPLAVALALACAGDDPLDDENAGFPDGKSDGGIDEGSPEALAVLALVNDPAVDVAELDDDAGLHATAAKNIVARRPYDTLAELDAVPFVGPVALAALLDYAKEKGLLGGGGNVSVIFSPQPADSSHNARVAQLIDAAQHTIDIAMYSFSDAGISAALERAVDRGVEVRFVFETANEDKKLTGSALASSKSGRLEAAGVNVRFVNKIMHHKFAIIDGPRDDVERAASATLVTGSGNWSFGGGSVFDENTLFMTGQAELAMKYQREFDLMWNHSRDLVADASLPFEVSTADLSSIPDDPGIDAFFTSDNFDISAGSTTFRTDKSSQAMAARWVAAIQGARESIHVASGHLRLKPVAEALIAAKQASPDLDIKVYLDQQEFISASGDDFQKDEVEECLAEATTDSQRFDCENKEFLWSRSLVLAGIDVRYKSYAFRWDHSYAVQMHHKYMIVDGEKLFSGSYNLSMNAEHDTFENCVVLEGAEFADVVSAFEANFAAIWETGRPDDLLSQLRDEIATADPIPIVFPSMALTWQEFTDLRALITTHCTQINSDEFRKNAAAHKVCPRQ
ncbi:MAG TPA: phospholipase D-like domain-containing protein [Kofleriaceae bacterium]|nr:phospholipase D-like domain-containing protein [Kofleriaceae bacterium]